MDVLLLSPYLDATVRWGLLDAKRGTPEAAQRVLVLSLSFPLQIVLLDQLAINVSWQSLLEAARIGSLLFIFADSANDQIAFSSTIGTFDTRLSVQALRGVSARKIEAALGRSEASAEAPLWWTPESRLRGFLAVARQRKL